MGQVIISIGWIKITSIESGGSLNIGEHIISCPTSKMSVEAGAGSLLKGDGHTICITKPGPIKQNCKYQTNNKNSGGERGCL